jgi:uncharacterized RDD family membrane protein YckC
MPESGQKAEEPRSALPTRRDPQAGRRPEDVAVGMFMFGARLGVQAGRVAILPLRAAGRLAGATRVDRAAGVLGADGRAASAQGRALVESAVDRTLAGPLPETVAQKLVEHHVVERIAADVMRQIDLDALVTEMLADERTREQLERALANPALERLAVSAIESKLTGELTERLLGSPQVHAALARQTTSMASQVLGKIRAQLRRLDDHVLPRTSPDADVHYGGIATRGFALTVDALLAHLLLLAPVAAAALIVSLAGGVKSTWLVDTILGVAWVVVVGAYFVFFWAVLGQTPGMILMGLRVVDPRGKSPSVLRSIVRLVGLIVSIWIVFLGFVSVPFDRRRRGLADFVAGTRVHAEQ